MTLQLLWKILFYGWTASEMLLVVVTRTRRSGGKLHDRGSIYLIWIAIVGSIFAAEWIRAVVPAPIFPGIRWLPIAAIVIMILGLVVRWIAILSLGRAFSVNVAIRDAQQLYQKGLYRFVRHPSYTGMVICFVAIALAERNWYSAAIVLVIPNAALLYRIHVEEAALRSAFGAQYQRYQEETKRLIPGLY